MRERDDVKQFALGVVTGIAVLGLGAWSYLELGLAGVQADESAPHWENRLMSSAVRASVHRSAAKIQSKVPTRDENLVAGGKLYVNGCAGCHGELGKPPRPHRILYTPIPQLPEVGTEYSSAEVFWVVKHGIRRTGMSAYGPFYSEEQIWDLAAFLERIKTLSPGVLERIQSKATKNAGDLEQTLAAYRASVEVNPSDSYAARKPPSSHSRYPGSRPGTRGFLADARTPPQPHCCIVGDASVKSVCRPTLTPESETQPCPSAPQDYIADDRT